MSMGDITDTSASPRLARFKGQGLRGLGPGVWQTIRQTGHIIWYDADRLNISLISAGVGFFTTLSIFPALAVLVMAWSLLADPVQINGLVDLGAEVMPPDVHQLLSDQINALIQAGTGDTLGWATIITGLFAFWSARAGVHAITRGLDAVYETRQQASYLRRELLATALTLSLYALAVVVAVAIFIAPIVLSFFSLGALAIVATELLRFVIAVAAVMAALTMIYRYGPYKIPRTNSWMTPGTIVATVIWLVVSVGFSVYLQNFANYNEVYGSLGAIVALLMWVYLSAYAVLLGGALNAQYARNRVVRMTDPGYPKPVADNA